MPLTREMNRCRTKKKCQACSRSRGTRTREAEVGTYLVRHPSRRDPRPAVEVAIADVASQLIRESITELHERVHRTTIERIVDTAPY